ncbi:hypothetical protein AMTR_s00395p00016630, partial [Amborella trichopoda]
MLQLRKAIRTSLLNLLGWFHSYVYLHPFPVPSDLLQQPFAALSMSQGTTDYVASSAKTLHQAS